jgi:DNA polymerase-3 subunit alpha (Gram-positive type)
MVEALSQIEYMFPKSHALSYVTAAMKIYWFKINKPTAFYASALNRYGVDDNNNSSLDFMTLYDSLKDKDTLFSTLRHYEFASDNPAKIKSNKRLASILYEAKLRGIKIEKADFSSLPGAFSPSHTHENVILSPLTSMKGVGNAASTLVAKAYEKYGDSLMSMTRDELSILTIEKDGKEVKAFGKKVLDAFFGE